MKLSDVLRERGYVYQHSSQALEEITDGPKRTVYLGIDPSADSLHVGNLVGLLVLRRFLEDGHKIIILTGGGTGMIGDPGGKSEERNLLDEETISHNVAAVSAQIRSVFGSGDFIEENNAKWLSKLKLLEFLRDIGKHFTVNTMIKKDIVKNRLDIESPISFTEFSYSLLQGYDFLHLNQAYNCEVQVGGSDQWSNILAGVDFIRKKNNATVYAFTWPLVINKSTGKKFGKSETGAIWLDAQKTSPFQFYQFWINTADESAEEYLKLFTLLSEEEIDTILDAHRSDPSMRVAQKRLAREVTILVHGEALADDAEKQSQAFFSGSDASAIGDGVPSTKISLQEDASLVGALITSGLASSKREARQFLAEGAISLNGEKVLDRDLSESDFKDGKALLKRGKKNVCVLSLF